MRGQDRDKGAASSPAIRFARPTLRIALPSTKPLSTSQNAADWNPANTTSGAATRLMRAVAKNNSATRYSGSRAVAHSPTVTATSAPGHINAASIPDSIPVWL